MIVIEANLLLYLLATRQTIIVEIRKLLPGIMYCVRRYTEAAWDTLLCIKDETINRQLNMLTDQLSIILLVIFAVISYSSTEISNAKIHKQSEYTFLLECKRDPKL